MDVISSRLSAGALLGNDVHRTVSDVFATVCGGLSSVMRSLSEARPRPERRTSESSESQVHFAAAGLVKPF